MLETKAGYNTPTGYFLPDATHKDNYELHLRVHDVNQTVESLYPDSNGCSMVAVTNDDNEQLVGGKINLEYLVKGSETSLEQTECYFGKKNPDWKLSMESFCP